MGLLSHAHNWEEEGFYVLDGEVTLSVNGERTLASEATFASMPVGLVHSFWNESGRPARMLISVAPARVERMCFECGVLMVEGRWSPADA